MNYLVKLDAFQQALVEAKTIEEVKGLRNQADVFTQWLRKQRAGLSAQNAGAEMKLRADRRLGEMLSNQVKPGNPQLLHGAIIRPKLSELGIEPTQSHRWQKESLIPIEIFEQYLAEAKEKQ